MFDPTKEELNYECLECSAAIEKSGWCSDDCFNASML
jgi:hypothetical protein|tara:strand:- start:80 stop:190 length:111 start_codon:yes stop_codon:yes gene_type:complete